MDKTCSYKWYSSRLIFSRINGPIFPDEGSIAETSEFYLQLSAFLTYHLLTFNSFSGSISPKFEHKLGRHKQRFGKIDTTVVLDKDENMIRVRTAS